MRNADLNELRLEFDKFVKNDCSLDASDERMGTEESEEEEDEYVPQFVDALTSKLLAPAVSGVYLSRIDIKRVAEAIDESIPIKERIKMVRALFRHTTKKEYLKSAFNEINKHINGRILIYTELSEAFPASKVLFDEHIKKAKKTMKMFDTIITDFEEIEATSDPLMI